MLTSITEKKDKNAEVCILELFPHYDLLLRVDFLGVFFSILSCSKCQEWLKDFSWRMGNMNLIKTLHLRKIKYTQTCMSQKIKHNVVFCQSGNSAVAKVNPGKCHGMILFSIRHDLRVSSIPSRSLVKWDVGAGHEVSQFSFHFSWRLQGNLH